MSELRIKFDPARRYDDQLGEIRAEVRKHGPGASVRKRSWGVAVTGDKAKLSLVRTFLPSTFKVVVAESFSSPDQ